MSRGTQPDGYRIPTSSESEVGEDDAAVHRVMSEGRAWPGTRPGAKERHLMKVTTKEASADEKERTTKRVEVRVGGIPTRSVVSYSVVGA